MMANFTIGDYKYTTINANSVSVQVVDTTKATYDTIPNSVTYGGVLYSVVDMESCFEGCASLVTPPTIPSGVTNMRWCFMYCTSLTTSPTIPNGVTNMNNCFNGCASLTTPPTIPDSVTDIRGCFGYCTSLTTTPIIPNNIDSMFGCFSGCTLLTTPPIIPDGVTNMEYCFTSCELLTTPPTIPNSVVNMNSCFANCTSLISAPVIPEGVINMVSCFSGCTSLTTAPIIPSSVTDIRYCFQLCTSLSGDIYILKTSSFEAYAYLFYKTVLPIVLHADSADAQNWARTAGGNVTVGGVISPMLLNTQFVAANKYRIDMLLNCTTSGSITGMIPNGVLYDMNDNEIEFGIDLDFQPSIIRCYAIIRTTNQVPNANTNITIKNVAPSSSYTPMSVGVPSTATPSVIKQNGQANPISPQINVSNIRFNPEASGLSAYTIGDVLNRFGYNWDSNYTKTQTNVDGDVKHIVTHADNVKVDNTTTLQDWITEQYNYLIP